MAAFTLAHLSDPHLPPLPKPRLGELAGKRALGYLNWTRNRHKYHRREVLDRAGLRSAGAGAGPYRRDRRSRQSGARSGVRARRRPGSRASARRIRSPRFPAITTPMCARPAIASPRRLASYIEGDEPACPAADFPCLRRRGPLALIGLSSAVPTPPLMATGTLGQRPACSAGAPAERAFRRAMPFACCWCIIRCARTSRIKRLTDAPELIALLKKHGVELVLHGHDHIHSTMWIDGPERQIPVDRRAVGLGAGAWAVIRPRPTICSPSHATAMRWRCEQTVRADQRCAAGAARSGASRGCSASQTLMTAPRRARQPNSAAARRR